MQPVTIVRAFEDGTQGTIDDKAESPFASSSLITSAFLVRTYQEANRHLGNIIPASVLQSRGHEIRFKMKGQELSNKCNFFGQNTNQDHRNKRIITNLLQMSTFPQTYFKIIYRKFA